MTTTTTPEELIATAAEAAARDRAPEPVTTRWGAPITDPLPAVDCASWCQEGDGHTSRLFDEDDACSGDLTEVKLNGFGLVEISRIEGESEFVRDYLEVQNFRTHHGAAGRVHLGHESDSRALPSFELVLSKPEALALSNALRRHAEQLED